MATRLCLDCRARIARGTRCRPCKNRRRGRAHQVAVTERLAYDRHRCVRCGEPCPHPRHHGVDHIAPVRADGPHVRGNLRTLCDKCNAEIGA